MRHISERDMRELARLLWNDMRQWKTYHYRGCKTDALRGPMIPENIYYPHIRHSRKRRHVAARWEYAPNTEHAVGMEFQIPLRITAAELYALIAEEYDRFLGQQEWFRLSRLVDDLGRFEANASNERLIKRSNLRRRVMDRLIGMNRERLFSLGMPT